MRFRPENALRDDTDRDAGGNQRRGADAVGGSNQLFELEDEHYEQDRSRR